MLLLEMIAGHYKAAFVDLVALHSDKMAEGRTEHAHKAADIREAASD